MPWSPVPKFPGIVENLKATGRKAVGIETLENEIIKETGATKSPTIKRYIQLMERLGYIKKKVLEGNQVWVFDKELMESEEIENKFGV